MPSIYRLGVDAVYLTHAGREIGFGRLDKKMVMIGHKAKSVADPPTVFNNAREDRKETPPVAVVKEDSLAGVSPRSYMVEGAGILNS